MFAKSNHFILFTQTSVWKKIKFKNRNQGLFFFT